MKVTTVDILDALAADWREPRRNGVPVIPRRTNLWSFSAGPYHARVSVTEVYAGSNLYIKLPTSRRRYSLRHKDQDLAKRQAVEASVAINKKVVRARAAEVSRKLAKLMARRTRPLKSHCKNGHRLVPENIYLNVAGQVWCRTCWLRSAERGRIRNGHQPKKVTLT